MLKLKSYIDVFEEKKGLFQGYSESKVYIIILAYLWTCLILEQEESGLLQVYPVTFNRQVYLSLFKKNICFSVKIT